jgi:hypothetical protein
MMANGRRPCYEGGTQILFPVADASLVFRYIEHKSPDFIVMYNHGAGLAHKRKLV